MEYISRVVCKSNFELEFKKKVLYVHSFKMPKNNTQSALRPNEPLSWYGYVKKFLFFSKYCSDGSSPKKMSLSQAPDFEYRA